MMLKCTIFGMTAFTIAWCATAAPALSQNLTVNIQHPSGAGSIELSRSFDVVIRNSSRSVEKVWDENCSWGWQNIRVIMGSDKEKLLFERHNVGWRANLPSFSKLPPGESTVRHINLLDNTWPIAEMRKFAKGRPNLKVSIDLTVTPDRESKKLGIWVGTVSSDYEQASLSLN